MSPTDRYREPYEDRPPWTSRPAALFGSGCGLLGLGVLLFVAAVFGILGSPEGATPGSVNGLLWLSSLSLLSGFALIVWGAASWSIRRRRKRTVRNPGRILPPPKKRPPPTIRREG